MNSIYTSLLELFGAEEQARVENMRKRWNWYYGKLRDAIPVEGRFDDNIRMNYAKLIVDKGVSFLFGKEVTFEIDEVEETEAEVWLKSVWEANRKMTLLHHLALNGAVTGQAFVKILNTLPTPRLIVLDPETVSVAFAPDDFEQIIRYTIAYTTTDPKTSKPIGVRQIIELDGNKWRIVDQLGNLEALQWRTINEVTWPYPFAPIVHCQNLPLPGDFWGQSDIEDDVIEIIKAINFIASNSARIIRFHAHPKTWGRGFRPQDLRPDVDKIIVLPGENALLQNLEMHGDLASSLNFLQSLRQALFEISRVPEVAFGNLSHVGGFSDVALQIMYQPLLEKTNTKRLLYGDLLAELNRRLLIMGGFEEQKVKVHWPSILPSDMMAERQAALIDNQLGVSRDTILRKLGYDPNLETQKVQTLGETLLTAFDQQ